MGWIYMILNGVNGKVYIGKSINIKKRFQKHRYHLNHNNHPNSHLQSAWNKYGKSNFSFLVLEECDDQYLDEAEVEWISKCNSTDPSKGYNLENGGDSGYVLSDEIKKKISIKNKGKNNPFYGKKHSEESRRKMSESRKGKSPSNETLRKMSENFKGENNPQWGKSIIDEYGGLWFIKQLMSVGLSQKEFCRYLGINKSTLQRYLYRRGYSWSSLKEQCFD